MEADLASWGKIIELHTTGRRSGRSRIVSIGFVADGDTLLVAAAAKTTAWAANLRAHPACLVVLDSTRRAYEASEVTGTEHAVVVRELILKYGTPAERLGAGPAFRLRPAR